jgi:hypothetical protein
VTKQRLLQRVCWALIALIATLIPIGCGPATVEEPTEEAATGSVSTTQCEELEGDNLINLCAGTLLEQANLLQRVSDFNPMEVFEEVAEKQEADSPNIIGAIRDLTFAPKLVCKVTPTGNIVCAKLEVLLAYYDSDIAVAIVNDINYLNTQLGPFEDTGFLFKCPTGDWGSTENEDSDETQISDEESDAMKSFCALKQAELAGGISDRFGEDVGSLLPGLSGITGFDPLVGACLAIEENDMVETLIEQFEALQVQCSDYYEPGENPTQPQSLISEGGSSDVSTEVLTDDDGNITGVKVTDNETGETTTYEFGEAGDGSVTVTTDTGQGVTVKTGPDGTSQATVDQGGGKSSTYQFDSGGNYSGRTDRWSVRDNQNGADIEVEQDFDKDGNLIRSSRTATYDNGDVRHEDKDYINNGGRVKGWHWDSNDNALYEYWEDEDGKYHQRLVRWRSGDCIDPDFDCNQCRQAGNLFDEATQECLASNGTSSLCQSYTNIVSCCQSATSEDLDPLIIPNPDGDLVCSEDTTKEEFCSQKCSVADHVDCHQNCMRQAISSVSFNLLDHYCLYAISEECVSSDLDIDVGGVEGGVPPLPTVYQSGFADACLTEDCAQ